MSDIRTQWRVLLDVLDNAGQVERTIVYSHRPTETEAQRRADYLTMTMTPEGKPVRYYVSPPEVPTP